MFLLRRYLTTKLDLSTSLAILTVFLLLFSIPLSLGFFQQKAEFTKTDIVRATGENASLTLSSQEVQTINTPFETLLLLNTDSRPVSRVNVVIDYDPNSLELLELIPVANITTSFKTFTPSKIEKGRVSFSALTFDSLSQLDTAPFNGATQLAILRFKPIKLGSTVISFFFSPDSANDTSIFASTESPFDLLRQSSQLVNSSISIAEIPSTR